MIELILYLTIIALIMHYFEDNNYAQNMHWMCFCICNAIFIRIVDVYATNLRNLDRKNASLNASLYSRNASLHSRY